MFITIGRAIPHCGSMETDLGSPHAVEHRDSLEYIGYGCRFGWSSVRSPEALPVAVSQLRPLQVTWEMTQRCEWKASPTRATARAARGPQYFSTAEAFHLVDEVAKMHVPLLALSGGDPLL